MKPVYGRVIIVWKTFANGCGGESLLIFAHVRANNRLGFRFVDDCAQPSVIGDMVEQLGALGSLLNVWGHVLRTFNDWRGEEL